MALLVRTAYVRRTDPLEASVVMSARVVDSPPALTYDALVDLLERRSDLAEALRRVRDEPGWFGYWKAVEAPGADRRAGINRQRGWASDEHFERFRRTTHHRRHHRSPAPPDPMTEAECRGFVLGLLRRWIDWELSRGRR